MSESDEPIPNLDGSMNANEIRAALGEGDMPDQDDQEMTRISIRAPELVIDDIERIAQTGYYNTRSEAIRDAMRRHIEWAEKRGLIE